MEKVQDVLDFWIDTPSDLELQRRFMQEITADSFKEQIQCDFTGPELTARQQRTQRRKQERQLSKMRK